MILKLNTGSADTGNIDKLVESYKNLNIEQTVAKMTTDGVADAEIRATLKAQEYAEADIEQAIITKNLNLEKQKNITLTKLQTIGYKSLTIFVKATNIALNALKGILLSIVISGFIKWLDNVINREENLAKAAEEANNKINDINDSLNNKKKAISEYSNEYAKLAQSVDLLSNKNLSLSTEDYKKFLELSNQLSKTFPQLTKGYDENGNAILDLSGNVDSIVDSLNNLIETQQKLANQEISNNFSKIYEDYYESIDKTNKKVEKQIELQEKLTEAKEILLKYSGKQINSEKESLKYQSALDMFGVDASEYTITQAQDEDGNIGFIYSNDQLKTDQDILDQYNILFSKSIQMVNDYNNELNSKAILVKQTISTLLSSDLDFTNNLNKNLQTGIIELFQSFSPTNLPSYINAEDSNEVYDYLKRTYLIPAINLSEDIQEELSKAFNKPSDMSNKEYIKFVNELQEYFNKNNIKINLDVVVENEKELQSRLQNSIINITGKDLNQAQELETFTSGMNSSQIELFIQITQEATNAADAIELYNQTLIKFKEYEDFDVAPIVDGLKEIRSAYTTVYDAIEEYKEGKHLTLETVENLLSLDEKYLQYLYDENGQLTLNTEAYNALTEAKLNEMYTGIISNAMQTLNALNSEAEAAHYLKLKNIELKDANWDLAESELAVWEATLLAKKEKGEKTSAQESAFNEVLTDVKNQINLLNEAKKGMSFNDFYTGSSKNKSNKNKFNKEFDWIENSVENVESNIKKLNDVLSDTSGFKERLSLYDDLIKADDKLISTTKKAAKAYENEWGKASKKISKEYKNKILSGETFSIETITNESLANNIDNAIKAYDDWQSMLQKYNDAISKRNSDKQAKIKVKLELEETKLDIHSIIDEESMSSKQLNNYIKEEELLKKNILKYNLQLAETEEEKIKLQKEYNQYIKDNQDIIYENNKNERDNKISYYDSRIQDIQNAIDLSETKGGQGTEAQYNQINEYIDKQKEFQRQNYKAALEMRNNATYGTKEWDKYNQEIQDAQDNIYQLVNAQIENNRAILKLPIQEIEKQNEVLQERLNILNETKGKIEDSISSASNIVQNQIDVLNKQKEATEEYWDAQIESINEQKDALTKANEEIKQQLALEKAQYEFEKAKSQKTTKIYREGQGFVYESDQDTIRNAQEELDNQEYNSAIYRLEVELDTLERAKKEAIEAIDNQINSLELYKERIDSITESYEQMLQLQQLIEMFGVDAEEKIMNGDLSIIDEMKNIYNETTNQAASLQLQIESNKKAIEQIENYAEKWNGSSKTIIAAKESIEKVVTDNVKEIKSIQQRVETVKTVSDAWEETKLKLEEELGFIQNNQIIAKDEESIILGERLENIKIFSEKAAKYLKEITAALSQAEIKQIELNRVSAENKKIEIANSKKNNKSKTITVETMGEKHNGLESGYVGESKSKKKDTFKYIALSELKPEEIPSVLLKGEAILNSEQQNHILDNMKNSLVSGFNLAHTITSDVDLSSIKSKTEPINKTIEFNGDIVLNGVNDPNTLAKKIKNEFLLKLDQEFYK